MKKLLEGHHTRLTRFQSEDTEVMQRLLVISVRRHIVTYRRKRLNR